MAPDSSFLINFYKLNLTQKFKASETSVSFFKLFSLFSEESQPGQPFAVEKFKLFFEIDKEVYYGDACKLEKKKSLPIEAFFCTIFESPLSFKDLMPRQSWLWAFIFSSTQSLLPSGFSSLSPCFAFINFFAGVLSRSRGDLADLHY